MKKLITQIRKIFQNSLFRKWFFLLLGSFAGLVFCFTFYTYHSFKKNLQSEFTSYSKLLTERVALSVDDAIDNTKYLMYSLDTATNVIAFMNQKDASLLFPDINNRLLLQLTSYVGSLNYMDSIYLYSTASQTIAADTCLPPKPLSIFEDTNWMNSLQSADDESYRLFPRKKNDRYPYLLTMMKPTKSTNGSGAIIMNLDLSKIAVLSSHNSELEQSIYMISDAGEILFREKQEDILEPLDTVGELSNFNSAQNSSCVFVNGDTPYVYVQQHSECYPWYYVTVTYISEYSARLTNITSAITTFLAGIFGAILVLTFFFIIITTSPLRIIAQYLEMPANNNLNAVSEPEVQKIIHHIMTYIRTNQTLSEELNRQIDLQNKSTLLALQSQINPHFLFNTLNTIRTREIEHLGYDHTVPALTLALSRLLQYALDSTDLVTMETEFYYTDLYLEILNERYQHQLNFDVHLDEAVSDARIPKLTIQPLIENAVFHGCSRCLDTSNHVKISASREGDYCILSVEDDGVGIPPEKLKELCEELKEIETLPDSSIGLHNTVLRMHLLFGSDFKIDIQSEVNAGTRIRLIFPALES